MLLLGLAACDQLPPHGAPGSVLFQDDFSRTLSGWDRLHERHFSADYQDDAYHIWVATPNTDVWASPGLLFDDAHVAVQATKLRGPDNNVYGILCRYQDPANYYFFAVSSDGFAGIGVNKDGRRRILTGGALLPTAALRRGEAANVLQADCVGYELKLLVNGVPIAEAQAAEWQEGEIGLMAGTYDQGGVEVAFDNFSVVRP